MTQPRVEVLPIEQAAIRFTAQVARVQTLADGGLRLVLDLPETAVNVAAEMMKAKQAGAVLEVAAVAVLQSLANGTPETNKRTTTSPIDMVGG